MKLSATIFTKATAESIRTDASINAKKRKGKKNEYRTKAVSVLRW